MSIPQDVVDSLLQRAQSRDEDAVSKLLDLHRDRIRKMVSIRLQPSVMARVDPSDVVQETLGEATKRLPEYLDRQAIAFYPWLRQLAEQCVIDTHRRHLRAQQRTVLREALPDASSMLLVDRIVDQRSSPSHRLQLEEQRRQVQKALAQLAPHDREVLVLRYLEEVDTVEISQILGVSERTVWRRHRNALEQLSKVLAERREAR